MKSRSMFFAVVCMMFFVVMFPAISMAASFNVASYDELLAAIGSDASVINITGSFTVDKALPHELMDDRPTLPSGCVFNGNGHTITVKVLKNFGNGGELFATSGNCIIKNVIFDASGLEQVDGNVRLMCLHSGDVLENVTIKANSLLQIGATTAGSGTVTVKNCNFSNVPGHAIYNAEDSLSSLNITDSTFDNCAYVTIARGENNQIQGNTITNGKLNVMGSSTINSNTFGGKTRVKFYQEDSAKDFSGNVISDESYIEVSDVAKNTDVSKNTYEDIETALKDSGLSEASKEAAQTYQPLLTDADGVLYQDGSAVFTGKEALIFKSTVDFQFFRRAAVEYNGAAVAEVLSPSLNDFGIYISEGSIQVELSRKFLSTLKPGKYTIRIEDTYTNGVSGSFFVANTAPAVAAAASVPLTGDSSPLSLWLALMVISGAAFVTLARKLRFI